MRVLLVHNLYRNSGGEDSVYWHEKKLLENYGHTVTCYERHNVDIDVDTLRGCLSISKKVIWNSTTTTELSSLIKRFKPDIAHFHNTFPLVSPSAYYVCQSNGVPVVQTLHNYRLICPKSTFFRYGKTCEDCLGKYFAWPSVYHRCYDNSLIYTSAIVGFLTIHRLINTWQKQVNIYISPTQYAKSKFVQAGFSSHKIAVKPSFLSDDPGERKNRAGEYVLFVGRLSEEKGLLTLLNAWSKLKHIPLKIIGNGPLEKTLNQIVYAQKIENVEFLGWQTNESVLRYMKGARFLVFPSECYEGGLPVTIVEAFACGLPVLASNLGAMSEVITHKITGILFDATSSIDLASKAYSLWSEVDLASTIGVNVRRLFEEEYTAERNYNYLINIYKSVL